MTGLRFKTKTIAFLLGIFALLLMPIVIFAGGIEQKIKQKLSSNERSVQYNLDANFQAAPQVNSPIGQYEPYYYQADYSGVSGQNLQASGPINKPASSELVRDEEKEGKGFYITPGMDKCLALYSPLHFEETSNKVSEPMFTNKKARTFQRLFFSMSSSVVTWDKQGRIIIPQLHKDYAGLKKDVIIVGVMDKIEIWDLQLWKEFEQDNGQNFERDAEDLFRLGSLPNE